MAQYCIVSWPKRTIKGEKGRKPREKAQKA
jgi:hypothetical protein